MSQKAYITNDTISHRAKNFHQNLRISEDFLKNFAFVCLYRQPLMPLRLTPAMIYFLRKMNTRNSGAETMATAAICTG